MFFVTAVLVLLILHAFGLLEPFSSLSSYQCFVLVYCLDQGSPSGSHVFVHLGFSLFHGS